ncbi:subtilase-type protease inhibitor [Streptomyces sp. NPDC057702]|uniref:subtilase-type protease inhibitor n=1 Tax=unclassified Streptomyces TaxID=2593676 RepID=UPI00368873E6
MRNIAGGFALAAALSLGCLTTAAGSAHAGPARTTSLYPPSSLVLSVAPGEDASAAVTRAVTLTCEPQAGGSHPAPRAACAELRVNGAAFAHMTEPAADTFCTREYQPVTVVAQGVWEGRNVTFQHTFGNSCLQQAARGTVFRF